MNARKITYLALNWLPGLVLLASATAKFMAAEPVVQGLTAIGFIPHFPLWALGLLEVVCAVAFLIPKTWRIGFFLVNGYLGGAASVEIAGHQPPIALAILTLVWIGAFLREKELFLGRAGS